MKGLISVVMLLALLVLPMTALAGGESYLYSSIGGVTSIYGTGETGLNGHLDLDSFSSSSSGLTAIDSAVSLFGDIQANNSGIGVINFYVNTNSHVAEGSGYSITSVGISSISSTLTIGNATALMNSSGSTSGTAANY